MNVEIIDYQPNALSLLIYTKNTRLKGTWSLTDVTNLPMVEKLDHLEYMKKTIQSSFEFINYTFEITGVSRSFTHQLVRTRNAVYAQESMRTVDVRDAGFNDHDNVAIKLSTEKSIDTYSILIDNGTEVQDARDVLPMGIHTSIIMRTNLRELMHMAEVRLCKRTQGEYQDVFKLMVARIAEVHPYFEDMLQVYCVKHGICCFPNYKECPVQDVLYKVPDTDKIIIKEVWEESDHVANPIAKEGKTM